MVWPIPSDCLKISIKVWQLSVWILSLFYLSFSQFKEKPEFLINIPPIYERKNDLDSNLFFGRLFKPTVDEKFQFALELLTRTQGNPIWFRDMYKKIKQNRECNDSEVYKTFAPCLLWIKHHALENRKRMME